MPHGVARSDIGWCVSRSGGVVHGHGRPADQVGIARINTTDPPLRWPPSCSSSRTDAVSVASTSAPTWVNPRSGNAANWGTAAYWSGWCYPDAAAAAALVQAGVSGVGFDGPSADPVDSVDYELHHVWLAGGVIILENLAAMDQLPARCRIVVAPLKVSGANGGPARVLALVDD